MNRLTKVVSIHANEPEFYEANIELYPEMMGYEHQQAEMDCINKLGRLEDIEDEIGIDLTILFKALNKGFYIKYNNKIVHIFPDKNITINFWYNTINVYIPPKFFIDCKKGTDYLSEEIDEEYWFKDYGKTWSLGKGDLENE